jgi:hypothetical protein
MKNFLGLNADVAGFWTSMLCAVHCSAIPVLMSLGMIGSQSVSHNHTFDWIIIGLGLVIAGYSLVSDYAKHKNKLPLGMAMTGFCFLFIGMIDHHGWMLVFSVIGGLLVASSHIVNHRVGHTSCSV